MHFKDIIGQTTIKNHLIHTVKTGRISHAQLFFGPPGVGKLPLAIAFAQYLSCENPSDNDSCGVCPSCKKFAKFVHPDLHFVFPVIKADNKKPVSDSYIEQWRETLINKPYFTFQQWLEQLESQNKQASIYRDEATEIIRKLSLKTYESEFKTMIIWLPEKMNRTAANKLLKMIEEPPPKTVFLLISEDANSVLPTIFSRTTPVKIPAIDTKELANYLSEKYNIDHAEAMTISRMSRGNFAEARNHLAVSDARKEHLDKMKTWLPAMINKNIAECIEWAENTGALSREIQKGFLIYTLRFFREMLMMRTKNRSLIFLTEEEKEFAGKISHHISLKKIHNIQEQIETAHYHIERNGTSKIILLDLSFNLIRLIQK
ncbi:MAG: DNA polymerase III subunit delta [Bacteroidales bacterium]|jgi:DNA polymerase-3 subunit delta'|nr:DNA polymerase III subunit delta [Bacteroidales bacterium]